MKKEENNVMNSAEISAYCPGCDSDNARPELWDYIPEDIFPENATVKGHHKYLRLTEWEEISKVNESNKEIVDDYIEYFREHFPEKAEGKTYFQILTENDDIWEKGLYDDLLVNSFKNGDYVIDTYSDDDSKKYKRGDEYGKARQDVARQFDVIIDCTVVGWVCRPFVVFGIKHQHEWGAETRYDDYASQKLDELQEWRRTIHDRDTSQDYRNLEIQLFKEGHIHFELKDYGDNFVQAIRKVDHKAEKHKVTHDIW